MPRKFVLIRIQLIIAKKRNNIYFNPHCKCLNMSGITQNQRYADYQASFIDGYRTPFSYQVSIRFSDVDPRALVSPHLIKLPLHNVLLSVSYDCANDADKSNYGGETDHKPLGGCQSLESLLEFLGEAFVALVCFMLAQIFFITSISEWDWRIAILSIVLVLSGIMLAVLSCG